MGCDNPGGVTLSAKYLDRQPAVGHGVTSRFSERFRRVAKMFLFLKQLLPLRTGVYVMSG